MRQCIGVRPVSYTHLDVYKRQSQRPSKVIYDRAYSAISLSKLNDFDWNVAFKDIDWFHWTGIDPALSDNMVEICLEACKVAKSKGIMISCDLNYRKNLWSSEKAKSIMPKLMPVSYTHLPENI